jgi:hypothetical protein
MEFFSFLAPFFSNNPFPIAQYQEFREENWEKSRAEKKGKWTRGQAKDETNEGAKEKIGLE